MPERATDWRQVTFGLLLSSFAAYQMFKLPPALPLLLERYDYDRTLAGGFMSVYALMGLLLSLPIGRLVARQGPFRLVPATLGLLIVADLGALAMPESGVLMLAARGLEGVAFTVLSIVGPVLASAGASPRHLPLVIGAIATWIPVGQITATALAPLAFALQGWQSLWVLAAVGSAALILWCRALAPARPRDGAPDEPTAGAAESHAIGAAQRLGLLLAAAVFMLWACQYFAYMTWLPQYLVEVHGASVNQALAGYSLPVATLILFCLVTGALLRLGVPLALLLPLALASQAAVWWLIPVTGGGWPGLASLVGYGIGAGITPTCLFAMPSAILGQGRAAATAFAYIMTGRSVGVFLGPILLAEAFKSVGSWDVAVPIFGVVTSAALAAGVLLALRLRTLRSTASA